MTRRIAATLLWLLLLPVVGSGLLLWRIFAALVALRPKTLLTLVGLVVALSSPNPITEQFAAAGVWPPGHEILVRLLPAVGVGVLYHGLRSRGLKALWQRLQHAG